MTLLAISILSWICPLECVVCIAIGTSLAISEILFFQPTESTQ